LILGITTIVHGNSKGDVLKMVAGLIVIAVLLWVRYFDNDLSFITRGIVFLIVGGMFFVINLLVKDKVEDIQRHKTLSDEK
jgi:Na+/proline symporter